MWRVARSVAAAGRARVVSALGGLFLAAGVVQSTLVLSADAGLIDFVLIGLPGLGLLYVGSWLSRSDVRDDLSSRVALWCLGGAGLMLGVVVLLTLDPAGDVSRPLRAAAIAAGLGALGGFPVGADEDRALTRAREAERHRDELRRERDLREPIVETSPVGIAVVEDDGGQVRERARRRDRRHPPGGVLGPPVRRTDVPGARRREREPLRTDPGHGRGGIRRGAADRAAGRRGHLTVGQRGAAPGSERRSRGGHLRVRGHHGPEGPRGEAEGERREAGARSNDRLRQFAYAAVHDLKEPLRMVSSYLQLLENRYGEELADEGREFLQFAVDGADRMHRMVEALLAYSLVERGELEFDPVDCEAVVDRAREDLRVQIEGTDDELVVEPLPTVAGDEQQLEQLFQNLVSNALMYADGRPRVEIAAEERDDEWLFSVADNGIGVDPDRRDRIFEVFKRFHRDEEYAGTGIGLSLCQNVVQNHGGDIWVASEPGEGSTFYLRLPRREPEQGRGGG